MSETYLPLLAVLGRLAQDGISSPLTLSISQPLAAMMDDVLLRERFSNHLTRLVDLGKQEVERTRNTEFAGVAEFYLHRFRHQQDQFNALRSDVLGAFIDLHKDGRIELITCVGTHGFLPLMLTDQARRAQVRTAAKQFETRTGFPARGMWMGECAYWWNVDAMLAESGVEYSFVEARGIERASRYSPASVALPILSPNGVLFFGRDPQSSQQVWSSTDGYPGDPSYRDFYRDLGFDLPASIIGPWIHPDGIKIHTGFKYYRVTGPGVHKEPYHRADAMLRVREHAAHFVQARLSQLQTLQDAVGDGAIITSPYDAELFGHWWFEGPEFLEAVFRTMHIWKVSEMASTPAEWGQTPRSLPVAEPAPSSWGEDADYSVWLNEENAWIYPRLRRAEAALVAIARRYASLTDVQQHAVKQAAREFMLAQASDWAFIIHNKTATQYAEQQTNAHLEAFWELVHAVEQRADVETLRSQTAYFYGRHPVFPDIDPTDWA
jgi:1,4-alpha-glucan branching enzyme